MYAAESCLFSSVIEFAEICSIENGSRILLIPSCLEQREKNARNLKFLNRLTNLILHAPVLVLLYEVNRQVTMSKE